MKKFKNEFKNKFKDTDKGKDRDLDSAQDDPEAADSPDPGTDGKDGKKSSISTKVTSFLKDGFESGVQYGKTEMNDAKKSLQKTAGLGHRPNVVPNGPASINSEPRKVEIGWHPVAGGAGKWFADSIIGSKIQERTKNYPDPTQHWAVLIGDYVHQLWMDGNLDIIYINEKLNREDWHTFEVGQTRFNDQALRKAARMTIHNMREKRAAYNLISNNCQNFAVNMLGNIQAGAHREFGTSFAVYQRATGEGAILDLWTDKPAENEPEQLKQDESEEAQAKKHDTINLAQKVMDENTTKLDKDHD